MAKCKNCINLEDHWCDMAGYSPDENVERKCGTFERMTKADKIRSMSDEELADFLVNFAWDNEPSVDETFKWLQSEMEE